MERTQSNNGGSLLILYFYFVQYFLHTLFTEGCVSEKVACSWGEALFFWNVSGSGPRFSILTHVLCLPPVASPTRFQGRGQRMVVLSPSVAETWCQESMLDCSFTKLSHAMLFTSPKTQKTSLFTLVCISPIITIKCSPLRSFCESSKLNYTTIIFKFL